MGLVLKSPPRPFTYADLEEIPDDGYRREIIGGTLIVAPSPTSGHQVVTGGLYVVLRGAAPPDTKVIISPVDWKTPDGGNVVPDVVVIRSQDFDRHGPVPAAALPLLVIEVLSPSNRTYDLFVKRELYERLGVPAYWIVDPNALSLLALRLVDGVYETEADLGVDGVLTTDWPFPLRIVVADLSP